MLAPAGELASSPQTLSGYTVTNVFPSLSSTGLRADSVTCRQPDTAGRRTAKRPEGAGKMQKRESRTSTKNLWCASPVFAGLSRLVVSPLFY